MLLNTQSGISGHTNHTRLLLKEAAGGLHAPHRIRNASVTHRNASVAHALNEAVGLTDAPQRIRIATVTHPLHKLLRRQ
jgi:hypothetical protein